MKQVQPDSAGFAVAVAALQAERVIAYPTETVYGLGVNPFSEIALDALFTVKEREKDRPVLLIVDTFSQIEKYISRVSQAAALCMEKFWPGPISLLFPAVSGLPDCLTDSMGRICVRCPDHPAARKLCRLWGGAITSTSANISGAAPARCAAEAVLPGVAVVLDAGELRELPPSTVFDPEKEQLLREGSITLEMIREAGVFSPEKIRTVMT